MADGPFDWIMGLAWKFVIPIGIVVVIIGVVKGCITE
jgi:NADH:ubiquinone oxidoreductase subunit H